MAHVGNCPYCGQTLILEISEDMSPEDIIRESIMHCQCGDALRVQAAEKFKEDAEAYANMIIDKDEIARIIITAAGLIADRKADVMVITHDNKKYSIKRGKSGPKIEVTETKKETME